MSFRNIPPIEPVRKQTTKGGERAPAQAPGLNDRTGAKLPVEGRRGDSAPGSGRCSDVTAQLEKTVPGTVAGSLGSLSRIRQQMASRRQNDDTVSSEPLEPESLYRAWRQYADFLRENRNPAVQSLELAVLRILDAQTFEVVTGNNLEQKFIEQEKRNLSEHLQKAFANKAITFTVTIEEKTEAPQGPAAPNKREQFRRIVEQYPLVKELKDRLRLELDY